MFWLLYTAMLTPFEVGFMSGWATEPPPEWTNTAAGFATTLFALNRVCDLVFLLDILVQFNLAYIDPISQRIERNRRALADRYLHSGFVLDALSTIPFDLIAALVDANTGGEAGVLRAMRALRVRGMRRGAAPR